MSDRQPGGTGILDGTPGGAVRPLVDRDLTHPRRVGNFEPFGGFADGFPIEDGYVRLPDAPGIGLEQKASLAPVLEDVLA